jgi:AcrR family transcriptional regulator
LNPEIEPVGKRAANKIDKLARIKRASHDLFMQFGYDQTTTRQIALEAGVSLATVFSYATNKRDLLFLVANDKLEATRVESVASIRAGDALIDNFVRYCSFNYTDLGVEPAFSRLIMRELLFYDSGEQGRRALDLRLNIIKDYEAMIRQAVKHGDITMPASATDLARVLFSVQQAEIRRWLAGDVQDVMTGIRWLWTSGSYVVRGVATGEVPAKAPVGQLRKLLVRP